MPGPGRSVGDRGTLHGSDDDEWDFSLQACVDVRMHKFGIGLYECMVQVCICTQPAYIAANPVAATRKRPPFPLGCHRQVYKLPSAAKVCNLTSGHRFSVSELGTCWPVCHPLEDCFCKIIPSQ